MLGTPKPQIKERLTNAKDAGKGAVEMLREVTKLPGEIKDRVVDGRPSLLRRASRVADRVAVRVEAFAETNRKVIGK